jgi:aspartate kinase
MSSRNLRIYKFGGASVKTADGVRNLANIVKSQSDNLIVVVSAMGKTTNALEVILADFLAGNPRVWDGFAALKEYHFEVLHGLFGNSVGNYIDTIFETFSEIETFLKEEPSRDYNYCYDQLVSFGEMLSTQIVSLYLNSIGVSNFWVDARKALISDCTYREGNVDLEQSHKNSRQVFNFTKSNLYITQGFIAGTAKGTTTTLGREGSDYTAALLANLLDAIDVTIWKDVEGVLSADPRVFPNAVKLNEVSFKEAIELAYCGAQIIHPKTIKPLQNKGIPLYVKSFLNPLAEGSRIVPNAQQEKLPPILVLKNNQVLISLSPKDYSFVIEDCLSRIFAIFYKHRVKVNLVQSSAISFSVCVDNEVHFLPGAMRELGEDFSVRFNENLALLTVRHYTKETIEELTKGKTLFLQQLTRSTARFVMDGVS